VPESDRQCFCPPYTVLSEASASAAAARRCGAAERCARTFSLRSMTMGGGRWGGAGGLASGDKDAYDSMAPDVSVACVAGEDCEGGEECVCS